MLMAMGYFDDEHTGGEMDDEEVVVDMEGELISALTKSGIRRGKENQRHSETTVIRKEGKM
jgi:hypothetical protein